MVERALYDFAEAAMGHNSEMSWSLSEAVMRRQISPVFVLCHSGELAADAALDVATDFVAARVGNTLDIFTDLFTTLDTRIRAQMPDEEKALPALDRLQEIFMGLNRDTDWSTDNAISRRELRPLFVRVSRQETGVKDAISIFCSNVSAKKDYYLEVIYALAYELTSEIVKAQEQET